MGNFKHFMKTKGFLVALGLCVVAAGVAGVGVINHMIDGLGNSSSQQQKAESEGGTKWDANDIQETPVDKNATDVSKPESVSLQERPSQGSASDAQSNAAQPSALGGTSQPQYTKPVSGDVTAGFSGNELVYNATMDDWRTHNGTDFAASYGEEVHSITAGTVKNVVQDVMWGYTVEVESPEGLVRYEGLAASPAVKAGDTVAAGDVLGKLDEISAEIALEPHLHVEYEKDGALCDVMALLAG